MNLQLRWLLAVLLACVVPSSLAQSFPSKPIRLVVPTSPGTATDLTARYLAEHLMRELGVSVLVENKAGANGIIATDSVAKSPPDGYTLLVAASTHYINQALYSKLPYDPVADFAPIARVNAAYLVLVTAKSFPVTSVAELTAKMRAQRGAITYASAGSGSSTHLAATLMTSMLGVEALHVPYKGGAQALSDTIGGQVQFSFTAIAQAATHIKADKLTALAITGARRNRSLPNVPTLAQSGLAGYEIASKLGLMAPRGLPAEALDRLGAVLAKIVSDKAFADFCEAQGLEVDYADALAYAGAADKELQYWRRIVTISGAKAE